MTEDEALLELLAQLQSRHYSFTAVTPETHKRVLARPQPDHITLRDIFGWNRPFKAADVDPSILHFLRRAKAVEDNGEILRSRVRVASLAEGLFLHSSFPTDAADSVFFGPDTYRFGSLIKAELAAIQPPTLIVDMGAGCGAGGIIAATAVPTARITLVDINPAAARFARINAQFAGVDAEILLTDRIPAGCDLIIANPPYMIDSEHRTYRNGGGLFGGEVSLNWARQALISLTSGGTLLLYTGAAMIDGVSPLVDAIAALVREEGGALEVRELDPDVFGEELSKPNYSQVERIAVVGIRIVKASPHSN